MENIRFLVLDDPWSQWESLEVQRMFGQLIELRKRSFGSRFSNNYAPVDTSDFHATHFAACVESGGVLVPIVTVRLLRRTRCEYYQINFPCLDLLQSAGAYDHFAAIEEFLDVHKEQDVIYAGAFALEPSLTGREREVAIATLAPLCVFACEAWDTKPAISISACKTGASAMYQKFGLKAIEKNGKALPPLCIPRFDNELFEVQTTVQLSEQCYAAAEQFQQHWDQRVELSS